MAIKQIIGRFFNISRPAFGHGHLVFLSNRNAFHPLKGNEADFYGLSYFDPTRRNMGGEYLITNKIIMEANVLVFFSAFYGQHSTAAAWTNPSPWSIYIISKTFWPRRLACAMRACVRHA